MVCISKLLCSVTTPDLINVEILPSFDIYISIVVNSEMHHDHNAMYKEGCLFEEDMVRIIKSTAKGDADRWIHREKQEAFVLWFKLANVYGQKPTSLLGLNTM